LAPSFLFLRFCFLTSYAGFRLNWTRMVAHPRWELEFARNNHRPDEVWIVFSGTFWLQSNPANWRVNKRYNKSFIRSLGEKLAPIWKGKNRTDHVSLENTAIEAAEGLLSETHGVTVRLIPVHVLLDRLFRQVPVDMRIRRKRYPDTALEMLRWVHRASRAGALDLAAVQAEYRTKKY